MVCTTHEAKPGSSEENRSRIPPEHELASHSRTIFTQMNIGSTIIHTTEEIQGRLSGIILITKSHLRSSYRKAQVNEVEKVIHSSHPTQQMLGGAPP